MKNACGTSGPGTPRTGAIWLARKAMWVLQVDIRAPADASALGICWLNLAGDLGARLRWTALAILKQVHQLPEFLGTLAFLFTHASLRAFSSAYFFPKPSA